MSGFPSPGGAPGRNRLVFFGLTMVVIGWIALVADLLLGAAQLQPGNLVAALSLKADIATLAQLLVVTGLGLAILGGLREGFGALNRFFDAVLTRSGSRPAPMPDHAPEIDDEDDIVTMPQGGDRIAAERNMPERGPSAQRNYTILPDGSVEVDTLLGTRIFASMDEARDFIR